MEEDVMITTLTLDDFLKENGFEGELSNKEKMGILNHMLTKYEEDLEWTDFKYSAIPKENITKDLEKEYANKVTNLDIKIMNIKGYCFNLKYEIKLERKEKRKQAFQKVFGVFKGNK